MRHQNISVMFLVSHLSCNLHKKLEKGQLEIFRHDNYLCLRPFEQVHMKKLHKNFQTFCMHVKFFFTLKMWKCLVVQYLYNIEWLSEWMIQENIAWPIQIFVIRRAVIFLYRLKTSHFLLLLLLFIADRLDTETIGYQQNIP